MLAALAMALAVWVIAGSLVELAGRLQLLRVAAGAQLAARARACRARAYAMTMAHVGLGVLVAGITASSAWQSEAILVMKPGDRAEVAGYQFTLAGIDEVAGAELRGQARDVRRHQGRRAGRPRDPAEALLSGRAAGDLGGRDRHADCWRDLYVVLGDPVEGAAAGDAHTVRIYHNPAGHVDLGRGDASWASPGCCRSAIGATGSARRCPARARLAAAPAGA